MPNTEAIEQFRTGTDLDPNNAGAWRSWGDALVNLGKYDEAIEKYQQAIGKGDQDSYAHNGWGVALLRQGKYEDAIEHYRIATNLDSNNVYAWRSWGDALVNLGKYDEAIEKYQQAIGKADQDSYAHNGWGVALVRQGKYEEAIEHYRQAAALDPRSANPQNGWGVALASQGKYDEAIEHYRQAAELDPKTAYPQNNWGFALASQGKFEDALEHYRTATELDSSYAIAWQNWGNALGSLGKYDEAIEKYQQALGKGDQDLYAHYGWGVALVNLGRYEDAIQQYREASAGQSFPYAYYGWGDALLRLKRFQEAIEKFEVAIQKDELLPWAYHSKAFVLSRQGRYKLALAAWEDAAKAYGRCRNAARPESLNDSFYYYYGNVVYGALAEFDDAEAIYLKGLELNPSHPGILRRLASLHWERAAKLGSENPSDGKWMEEFWKGSQCFAEAKARFRERISAGQNAAASVVELAEMLLNAGESGDPPNERFAEAEKHLTNAMDMLTGAVEQAAAKNDLGVLYIRREDFQKAVRCFEAALRLDPGELSAWSNLAEAYFKAGYRDKAHSEYRKILKIAPEHLDSIIGLGDVYIAAADEGDQDLYEQAVGQFDKALQLAVGTCPSKRLKPADRAAVYYSRGYARVKSSESAGLLKDRGILKDAYADFQQCKRLDEFHVKARQALRKLDQHNKSNPIDRLEKYGGPIIFSLAVIVFLLVQVSFFFHFPKAVQLTPADYGGITFGALLFGITGLSLPTLLKLKFGSFELERSQTEQITTSSQIGITAQGTSTLSSSGSLASLS